PQNIFGVLATKKAARRLLLCKQRRGCLRGVARAHRASEASAEFLDATGFDDTGLGTRVEGVRLGRHVTLKERVGLAFVLDGFTGVHSGTSDELRTSLLIQEHHFAVFGVDAFFHVDSCRGKFGSPATRVVSCRHPVVCTIRWYELMARSCRQRIRG